MPRRKKITQNEKPRFCVVCKDFASGVNFNALTCTSCKTFFRRNAFKQKLCYLRNTCKVSKLSRKFCSKCRLEKCLNAGMEKEWILSDQDKLLIKQTKITRYDIRRQKQMLQQETKNLENNVDFANQNQNPENLTIYNYPIIELGNTDSQVMLINQWTSEEDGFDQLNSSDSSRSTFDDLLDELDDSSMLSELFSSSESQDSDSSIIEPIKREEKMQHKIDLLNPEDQNNESTLESLSAVSFALKESIFFEIGFQPQELNPAEKHSLKEMMDACGVLQNPYEKIIDCNNDYYNLAANSGHIFRTQYHFHRMIQMSKRLSSFRTLSQADQVRMLKNSLLGMLNIQSIIMYNPDRKCWRFIDDRCKSSVMVRMDLIKPFCSVNSFERHQKAPTLFREEWKRDEVIFNLLLVIILFIPRPEYFQNKKIHEEHTRYTSLLRRYLEMKYSTFVEAIDSYNQLMNNVAEMLQLGLDVKNFFQSYGEMLRDRPLLVEVFDLDSVKQTEVSSFSTTGTSINSLLSMADGNI